ncbi:MAG: glycosyltransferase family 4 protein [Rhodospirillaceae bacterium]|nr:glycosyltransferase family 4 protein [Rhodospirillaceae bacterium]MCY4067280.1 glycosyltransferase family 4 protein [Rhodospirillaceae bacterium]
MKIAFYTPMKPPGAARPSGDRTIARSLLQAMAAAGHEAAVASTMRSYLAAPADRERRARIERDAAAEASRLIAALRPAPPDLWFTYHLFYKAPDLIGPAVCRALGLPYLVAEASYAPKRDSGPWADRQERVRDALGLADHVFFLNPVDEACVIPLLKPRATHSRLPPMVCIQDIDSPDRRREVRRLLAAEWRLPPAAVWAVAVGMMRPGDKSDSYRRLADAWMSRPDSGAHLLIVGDGAAGAEVRRLFSGCETRVAFLGILPKDALDAVYRAADLYVWPGVNEAIGMATLEAMAAGLPVAVGPWGSVAQGIESGVTGLVARTGDKLGRAVGRLIADPELRKTLGAAARAHVRRRHSLSAAADAMTAAFEDAAGRTP